MVSMRYTQPIFLEAVGYELPPVVVTSAALEDQLAAVYQALRLPMGQLEGLAGIRERRWWEKGFALSEGALRAARKALQGSGIPPQALGALVYGGVCREQFEPATACKIAAGIGLSDEAMVYDISNACLGVHNGLLDIANRIALGQIRCGMVVSCESAREINEQTIAELRQQPNNRERWMQSIATLTGGSGAIALILSDGSFHHYARPRLHSATCLSAPHLHDLCRWGVESDGTPFGLHQYARTDAVGVLKNGVALGMRTWERFLAEAQWRPESIDRVICHQVGGAHQREILRALQIDPSRDFVSYPYLGNTGSVALPITAAIAWEQGFLQAGHRVGFLGIGSGLNCMMQAWEWA